MSHRLIQWGKYFWRGAGLGQLAEKRKCSFFDFREMLAFRERDALAVAFEFKPEEVNQPAVAFEAEMEVRPGRKASGADIADHLSLPDVRSDVNPSRIAPQMSINRLVAAGMPHAKLVA